MKSVGERTNWNWVARDQNQTVSPFYSEKGKNTIDARLPTVNDIRESSDNCFIESTEQYKNLYIQLAKCYTSSEKSPDGGLLARRILNAAIIKIEEIETRKENRIFRKEIVKAIGELASQYIDMALKHNKTDRLLELFNEALNQILRLTNTEVSKTISSPKCILEHLELASDNSSTSNSYSNSDRKIFRLVDWVGDDGTKEKGHINWNWHEPENS
jgi:hypothetical protein